MTDAQICTHVQCVLQSVPRSIHQTETSFHKLEFGKVKLSICSNLFAFHFFFYLSDKIVFIASFKCCSLFTVFATRILVLQDLLRFVLITGSIKKTLLKPHLLSSLPFVIWDTRDRLKRVWGGLWSSLDGTDPIPYQQKKDIIQGVYLYIQIFIYDIYYLKYINYFTTHHPQ